MAHDLDNLSEAVLAFLGERHLAMLTTTAPDGHLHVTAVGFTYDPTDHVVRIITSGKSQKARNAARGGRAAVGQVDGARWLSLEGAAAVSSDPDRVAKAVSAYGARYRPPGDNPERVVLEIAVERILGRAEVPSR